MATDLKRKLVSDRYIADQLSMSYGWVRNQRWRRRNGQEHFLTLDPVMIGSSPRYRLSDVEAFIANLEIAND